ncbi:sodium-dependent glucose transporter 1A-like [Oppia nitens]|uniref:sodium-dependent glucose transporter 1A-like n=1 Tax=Oppia nitens TaxID=1686743 RepID=UPI0023DA76EA|nr:sodium-dependent glucose transporter 1A-like [Oppia nitens]
MTMESLTHKLLTTALIYFLFLQLAIRFGIFGPTILDLGHHLNVTQSQMSLVFSMTSAGVCVGAITSGFVFKWIPKQLAMATILVVLGIIVSFVTSIKDYYLFIVLHFIIGVTSGAAINGCEAWVLEIWTDACAPYMQALQFFRGLGYILGPIIAEPFLAPEANNILTTPTSMTDEAIILSSNNSEKFSFKDKTVENEENKSYIYIPYMINGLMLVFASVLIIFQYLYTLRQRRSTNIAMASSQDNIISKSKSFDDKLSRIESIEKYEENSHNESNESKRHEPKSYKYTIIILCSLFYLFFFEEVVVTYLASFSANIDLHLTKSAGAFLTSIFNLSNVIGKAVSIVLALKLRHFTMLYMNLTVIVISLIVLAIFSNTSLTMFWFGVCLLGIGLSSIIASLYALMENAITMNSMVCGILNMSGTLGSVFVPLAIANYIQSYPLSLIFASLLCAVCCVIIMIVINLVIVFHKRQLKQSQTNLVIEDQSVVQKF